MESETDKALREYYGDRATARHIIESCESDLARKLSQGERRDLLCDNTHWDTLYIADLVSGIAFEDKESRL